MRQIDIGMTLDEKIVDYLEGENAYRSPGYIAKALGENVDIVKARCSRLYWGQKDGLQRHVCQANADNHPGTFDDVAYLVPKKGPE